MGNVLDIYKVIVDFDVLGKFAQVRRWYRQDSGLGNAANLAGQFLTDIYLPLINILNILASYDAVHVENLNNPADFATIAFTPVDGLVPGDCMPPFVAWGFEMPSSDRNLRAGLQRVPGVSETWVENGVVDPLFAPNLDDYADFLEQTIAPGLDVYTPVLYTPGNVATAGLPLAVPVVTANYARVTSQNSRKT